jgi:DNA invertase Pin-like site-specific DNA recombinase
MTRAKTLRCAVYTRKSSDEGLDQAFNSLDAQREAGEAYIKSQAAEGWKAVTTCYDDGGYSGGTMERPALKALLADIDAGRIDVVVVYKIDRLTRSLADFARIVEAFDARDVSFVSVTQAFNTTTSMGRLTLNILLSFAQFEREVTGERIRDKIAASKAKGFWMGGVLPLGYDLPAPGTRILLVNDEEAEQVRLIFDRYLELGSVHRLAADLAQSGICSKRHMTAAGRELGGVVLTRGALYHLLRNRLYLGQITHKGQVYPAAHPAIVSPELFEAVQRALSAGARRQARTEARMGAAPLTGLLFDAAGHPMSPTFAQGRKGKRYRYYVSSPLQRGRSVSAASGSSPTRVAGPAIERVVAEALVRLLADAVQPWQQLRRVEFHRDRILLIFPARLAEALQARLEAGETFNADPDDVTQVRVSLTITLDSRGKRTVISTGAPVIATPDQTLIAALRRAHGMVARDRDGPFLTEAPTSQYARRIAGLAFLAPDIQRDILVGKHPPRLTLARLIAWDLPLDWEDQRRQLDWR